MKKLLVLSALLAVAGVCLAQEQGRVISSTPVVQQVAVPRQVCSTDPVVVQNPKTGAGAVMGAIAGGAIGNAAGGGSGKAALTALGLVGGAILGDRVEGGGSQVQNVQRCTTQTFYENRATAYNVVYEYNGRQYSVQMPNDPGPFVQLQVTPVGAQQAAPAGPISSNGQNGYVAPVVAYSTPTVVYAAPAYYGAPYYGAPYSPYYYPSVSLGIGYYGGYYGGGHHHHFR